jgi:hypothetical protein
MKISMKHINRAVAMAAIMGAAAALAPATAAHAQQNAAQIVKAENATPEENARATLRSETRIRRLHDHLKITSEQEELWAPVASVMRGNDIEFRTNLQSKTAEMKSSTAVNDLKAFQLIAEHHALGLKKLIPVFSTFYDGLPTTQRRRADTIFGESRGDARL